MAQHIQAFKISDGSHAYGPRRRAADDDFLARFLADAEAHAGEPCALYTVDAGQITDEQYAAAQQATATIVDGQVESVAWPQAAPEVWLHITITGGDGEDPPGAPIDGSAPLQVSAALRQTSDPASAIIPVSRSYRITIRTDTGEVYGVKKITLANGEMGPVSFSGDAAKGEAVCNILESDFEQVEAGGTTYTVRLAEPVTFKLFEALA